MLLLAVCGFFLNALLVVISTAHSPAGTTAPDAMRVERAGTFAQALLGGLR